MQVNRRSFGAGLLTGFALAVVITGAVSVTGDTVPLSGPIASASAATPLPAVGPPTNFSAVVKAVTPAVVNISTSRVVKSTELEEQDPRFDDPLFRRFFGDEFFRRFGTPRRQPQSGLGSGVIVDSNGYIVTNNHVIEEADEIVVVLSDKREFKGKVIGKDPKTDLAVIKIDGEKLPTVSWGNSDQLDVGEFVLAIGNPFGLSQTVTMGIVSAIGRASVGIAEYEDFIQTDAAINPGNSGGALVNTRGELVGINTAIFSRSGGYQGIGFAVPANMVRSVMDSLVTRGKVVRGWLGVSIQGVTADLAKNFGLREAKGALVSEVLPDSPAARSGLKSGDVIVEFDGREVEDQTALRNMVAQTAVDKDVPVKVVRDNKPKIIKVKIGEQPKNLTAGAEGSTRPQGRSAENTALAGVDVRSLTPELAERFGLAKDARGVVITDVTAESKAAGAGLRPGDVITEINRQPVNGLEDYRRIVGKLGKEDSPLLLVNRRGGKFFIVLKAVG